MSAGSAALQMPISSPSAVNKPPPLRPSTGLPAAVKFGLPRYLLTAVISLARTLAAAPLSQPTLKTWSRGRTL